MNVHGRSRGGSGRSGGGDDGGGVGRRNSKGVGVAPLDSEMDDDDYEEDDNPDDDDDSALLLAQLLRKAQSENDELVASPSRGDGRASRAPSVASTILDAPSVERIARLFPELAAGGGDAADWLEHGRSDGDFNASVRTVRPTVCIPRTPLADEFNGSGGEGGGGREGGGGGEGGSGLASPPREPFLVARSRKVLRRRLVHEEMTMLSSPDCAPLRPVYDIGEPHLGSPCSRSSNASPPYWRDKVLHSSYFSSIRLRRLFSARNHCV